MNSSPDEYVQTVIAGVKLTGEEAEVLEERLATDANDLTARSQLIVFHQRHAFGDPGSRSAHSRHVLWLIRNAPQAGILGTPHAQIDPHNDADGYIAGKDAWARHLEREPTNVAFLGHAASFYSPFQDRDRVIAMLEKAQLLDPGNAKWPMELGHLCLRDAASTERVRSRLQLTERSGADDRRSPRGVSKLVEGRSLDQASMAGRALENFRRAYELAGSDQERTFLLDGLAAAALREGGRTPDFGANLVY